MSPTCNHLPDAFPGISAALVLSLAMSLNGQETSEMTKGLDWLESQQTEGGAWIGDDDADTFRSTAAAIETLMRFRALTTDPQSARSQLKQMPLDTIESVAAQGRVAPVELGNLEFPTSFFVDQLKQSRNAFSPTGPNSPEGGWGLADGYGSSTLDTVAALGLFNAVAMPGLRVVEHEIATSETQWFRVILPPESSNARLLVSSTHGALVRFSREGIPTGGDPFFTITGGTGTIAISATQSKIAPGQNWIRIDGSSDGSYDLSLSYEIEGEEFTGWTEGLAYLIAVQNPDGGWPLVKGEASSIFVTASVLAALDDFRNHFASSTTTRQGALYLASRANPDGGFGMPSSSIAVTSDTYQALSAFLPADSARANALAYLMTEQSTEGHWNLDAYDTARAIGALLHSQRNNDGDSDDVPDIFDNCPLAGNTDQSDADGDGIGDACVNDADGDGLPDDLESLLGTNRLLADSTVSGFSDGDLDFSLDGRSNREAAAAGDDPLVPIIPLEPGLNLFTYPVEAPVDFSAYDLLAQLGGSGVADRILKFDPSSGQYFEARYSGSTPTGSDFPVAGSDGLMVYLRTPVIVTFPGTVSRKEPKLHEGPNLVRIPTLLPGETSFEAYTLLSNQGQISSIQRLDPVGGRFLTYTTRNGAPQGPSFNAKPSETYLVNMAWVNPRLVITFPGAGANLSSQPITVTGEVSPGVTSVQVAGIEATITGSNFTAPGVELLPGINRIEAIAVGSESSYSIRSVSVNFGSAPDYTLVQGGASATGTFTVTATPEIMSQVASYSVSISGKPAGINYSTDSATFTGPDSISFGVSLSASPTMPLGNHTFDVSYTLKDASNLELGPVEGANFTLKVLVVP